MPLHAFRSFVFRALPNPSSRIRIAANFIRGGLLRRARLDHHTPHLVDVHRLSSAINLVSRTALPYNSGMEFIETSLFTRLVYTYLTEEEYLGLQGFLVRHPETCKVVPGSGGVRKLRWGAAGKGKSGGVRVI